MHPYAHTTDKHPILPYAHTPIHLYTHTYPYTHTLIHPYTHTPTHTQQTNATVPRARVGVRVRHRFRVRVRDIYTDTYTHSQPGTTFMCAQK